MLALGATSLALTGCRMALMEPQGRIAAAEKSLIINATLLMLIVVVPVIAMTLVFACKYRESNKDMKFTATATSQADFDAWVAKVKASGKKLGLDNYGDLAKPSSKDPVKYVGSVEPVLFAAVLDKTMDKSSGLKLADRICLPGQAALRPRPRMATSADCAAPGRSNGWP